MTSLTPEPVGSNAVEKGPWRENDDRLLKASDIQRELGVSRATAYRMMTDGTLPTYRFGGRSGRRAMVRVSMSELRVWLSAHKSSGSVGVGQATC